RGPRQHLQRPGATAADSKLAKPHTTRRLPGNDPDSAGALSQTGSGAQSAIDPGPDGRLSSAFPRTATLYASLVCPHSYRSHSDSCLPVLELAAADFPESLPRTRSATPVSGADPAPSPRST